MNAKNRHHTLSLKLLAGRSLSSGSPWTFHEERQLIGEEKELWAAMSEQEREEEQLFLVQLWGAKGSERQIKADPAWGSWATGLMKITDSAFGIPRQDYRPYPKGLPLDEDPEFAGTVQWLWDRGFQVIDVKGEVITIAVPGARVIQEVDRLYKLLVQSFTDLSIQPYGSATGVQIRALYDPVCGQSSLELLRFKV